MYGQFFCISPRQDVPNFGNITKVKEGSPRNLFYVRVKGQSLVKDNSTVVLEAKQMPSRGRI